LQSRLKPFLLRREKEHVEKTVPPKQEVLIEVELTAIQKQYYRAIYEQKTEFLFKKEAKDGPSLSNLAMELRKCCLHLFLIKGADKELHAHFQGESTVDVLIKASAKMTLLDKLLPKLKSEGHRVLIFSQFRIMLDIIEDYLELKQLRYERVDGAVTGKDRQAAIDRFASDDGIFVMLLSTRAGGVGINLTQADTVIIFDRYYVPTRTLLLRY
jgi:chromodomain-helicase-DNA-binding protein 7